MENRYLLFALLVILFIGASLSASRFCLPGDESCFPSNEVFQQFALSVKFQVLWPHMPEYDAIAVMRNTVRTKFPFLIAVVKTAEDIRQCLKFARQHNLHVTVQSSGHDFNGRSTAHGSFQIYLGNMTNLQVNLNSTRNKAGEITCESGNKWLRVYQEVDKYNRVIIGGSAHTVAMGGYTLGGGHSPMSRMFGLAVDNLLEVEMVAADGRVVIANDQSTEINYENGTTEKSTNTDIFWALRGGGGGTYGIATKFTFKLHYAAPNITTFICTFPIRYTFSANDSIGFGVMKKITSMLPNMPREWGGYILITGNPNPDGITTGSIILSMNHYGPYDSPTRSYMDEIMNYQKQFQGFCGYEQKNSFLEYESSPKDAAYQQTYSTNSLMQSGSFTDEWIHFILGQVQKRPSQKSSVGLTGILLGGKMMEAGIHDTAVHPGFRSALMEAALGVGWGIDEDYTKYHPQQYGRDLALKMTAYGFGQYPNEAGDEIPNWQDKFWGSNYKRLLSVKQQWDPDNVFTCIECVGSEQPTTVKHGSHGSHGGQAHGPSIVVG